MSQRTLIISTAAVNALVSAISYTLYGWTAIGAHVAARSTARVSALIFALAIAQPGLARWMASLPSYVSLVYAFVAAHCVHFVDVATTLVLDRKHQLNQVPVTRDEVVFVGVLLVAIAGFTVTADRLTLRALHALAITALFAIFMLAFTTHRLLPLRAVAVLLGLAAVLRIVALTSPRRVSVA